MRSFLLATLVRYPVPAGLTRTMAKRAFVLSLMILPMSVILPLKQDEEHSVAGLFGMARWQLHLVGEGYWGGWADARRIVAPTDWQFFDALRSYVAEGRIRTDDRIAHVAEGSNLRASPFPAFTGISQDLYLPRVDTTHMHTRHGRLYDIRERAPSNRWVLVERSMLPYYRVDPATIVYSNERVILSYRGAPSKKP